MKADNVWLNTIKTTPALPFRVCDSQCPVEWIPSVTFWNPYQGDVGQWRMLRRKCWYSSKSVRSIPGREYYTRMMSTLLTLWGEGRNGVRKGKHTVRIVKIESTHSWKISTSLSYHFFSLSLHLSLSSPSLESGQGELPSLTSTVNQHALHTTFLL